MEVIKKIKLFIMLAASMLVTLSFTGCSFTKKIDLNKYVTIYSEGYETYGSAYYDFNLEKFEEDYSGKIKVTNNHQNSGSDVWDFEGKLSIEAMLLMDCVKDVYFDNDYDLSNGDEITLSMDINNTLAKEYYNVELEFTDMKYTVEGLKETKEFNPFDYISVSFSGIAPNGNVTIEPDYDKPEMLDLFIQLEGKDTFSASGYSNGDPVKINVSYMMDERGFASRYGEKLSQTEKEYPVEGLSEYVSDVSLIPQDIYDQMNQQLLDWHAADRAKWMSSDMSMSLELIGTYLLNGKPGMKLESNNRLYYLYKVSYTNKYVSDFTYYWYGEFSNIVINGDGSVDVDLNKYNKCTASSGFFSNTGDYLAVDDHGDWVAGFASIEDFEKAYIISKVDSYTYTKNIQEQ